MKAITFKSYGPPSVLQLEEIPKPEPNDNEVLIKIVATAVNSGDWRVRKADPFMVRLFFGLFSPRMNVLGVVFSGVIEEVGRGVTGFKAGDQVFGLSDQKMGTYAEYLSFPADGPMAIKPENLTHAEAASLVFGGHTAVHFLRQVALDDNKRILIYGASGSVGSTAVQLAKYHKAHVTGVCSTGNIDKVRSLGADEVIDYTQTDIYAMDQRYDVIYETVNKTDVLKMAELLKPKGTLILGAGLIKAMLQGAWVSAFSKKKVISGVAQASAMDLQFIAALAANHQLVPVIDRTYDLSQMVEAHAYVEKGHKKGNVVIMVTKKEDEAIENYG